MNLKIKVLISTGIFFILMVLAAYYSIFPFNFPRSLLFGAVSTLIYGTLSFVYFKFSGK